MHAYLKRGEGARKRGGDKEEKGEEVRSIWASDPRCAALAQTLHDIQFRIPAIF